MKKSLLLFYSLVIVFELLSVLFLGVYHTIYAAYSWEKILSTLVHCLDNNLMVAAWATLPVAFADLFHLRIRGNWYHHFIKVYLGVASIVLTTLYCLDIVLYGYWGFRLNLTPFVYVFDNPITALKESPIWAIVGTLLVMTMLLFAVSKLVNRMYPENNLDYSTSNEDPVIKHRNVVHTNALLLVLMALAWGGTTTRPIEPNTWERLTYR